ncbi:MAG TPA: AAA family ATPase [Pedobacter sp.]
MSKIRIKDFGPIKEGYQRRDGWLPISNVTVFIGSQGSGKSTVAKLISTMTWIEKALVRGDFGIGDLNASEFKRHISYQNIEGYFKDNSLIEYQGRAYHISYRSGQLSVIKNMENGYVFPKIMYVPSERNFVSSVRNLSTLKGLPSTLYTFSDEFIKAIEELDGQISLPIDNSQYEYQELTKLSYIIGDDYKIKLAEASSGFQSFVPLFIVTSYLANSLNKKSDNATKEISLEEEKRIRKEIEEILSNRNISDDVKRASLEFLSSKFSYSSFINIVEEPEQNLFPSSQHQLLNSLIRSKNINENNKLIITTHSPYIITYLSIAIQAGSLLRKNLPEHLLKKLDAVVPIDTTLKTEEINIYQLNEKDGTIQDLQDFEGIPSDHNFLNLSLAEGNVIFDSLLEIEQEL